MPRRRVNAVPEELDDSPIDVQRFKHLDGATPPSPEPLPVVAKATDAPIVARVGLPVLSTRAELPYTPAFPAGTPAFSVDTPALPDGTVRADVKWAVLAGLVGMAAMLYRRT